MKLRCYQCRGKFGLSRRYHERKSFCSRKCVDAYIASLEAKVQERRAAIKLVRLARHPVPS